jgi:tripartite ATP-independent transporter DctM subunit
MTIEPSISREAGASPFAVSRARHLGQRAENLVACLSLLAMGFFPVAEIVLRSLFSMGIPGTSGYVQNLTLWIGYLGAMIAARERRHLHLATGAFGLPETAAQIVRIAVHSLSALVAAGLFWASLQFVLAERHSAELIGAWLPIWLAEAVLPLAFAVITLRFVLQTGGWSGRLVAALAIVAGAAVVFLAPALAGALVWPAIAVLIAAALFRAPIFIVIGGVTLVLFYAGEVPAAALSVSSYRIVVSPLIPTIPLFTLAGYLLAVGGAQHRLMRLFRAWFGWLPGGEAIVATLLCAFFTTFTGASGVAILALGGLLLPVLLSSGYPKRFSLGLLTATGSIGLLFPPSIAVIIYATMAYVPIPDLFLAGALPGLIMVLAVCLYGVHQGLRAKTERRRFDRREACAAVRAAVWELMIPLILGLGIFGGFATLTEAAAVIVVYILCYQAVIHRELSLTGDLPRVLLSCITLIGGVFAILGVAFGLANYFVDAGVPSLATDWVQAHISSKLLFLLSLNLFLLVVGCVMDIFSAIVVVAPLLLPISQVFGIHPAHLGIIFLANLELGYLTPPVGMNLFLSAYRFDRRVMEVCLATLPFLFVLLLVVLLVTYLPALTLFALDDGIG